MDTSRGPITIFDKLNVYALICLVLGLSAFILLCSAIVSRLIEPNCPYFYIGGCPPLSVFMVTLNSIWCCGEIPLGLFSFFFGIVSVNPKGAWMVKLGIISSIFSIVVFVLMAVIPVFVMMSND
jgi:hypothetical protein